MIKEQYISFETAKLAKEKGFDEPCIRRFKNSIVSCESNALINSNGDKNGCSRPTQSLLGRWLREKHKMIVSCVFNYETKMWVYI